MRNGDIMKTIGMAAAAFLVACGASAAHRSGAAHSRPAAALGDERRGQLRRGVRGGEHGGLRPQDEARHEGAEGVSGLVAVRVEACARRGRRVAACRIAGTAVDGRQEHQHRVRPHAGQNHRSVGSMPTHKKTVGRVRWGVPGGAAMRLTRHDNSDWLLRCWLLVAETLPTH